MRTIFFVTAVLIIVLLANTGFTNYSFDSKPTLKLLQVESVEISILSRGFVIGNPHYVPENVTAKIGAVVVWRNGDAVHHTVTSDAGIQGMLEGQIFNSGPIPPREEFMLDTSRMLDDVYPYHCMIHPWAKGMLTLVTEPISVTTDKSSYFMGEKVTVSGIASIPVPFEVKDGVPKTLVNATIAKSVSLQIFNPRDELFLSKDVPIQSGGSYSYTFTVGEMGTYRVDAAFDSFSASATFQVVKMGRDKLIISPVKFEDQNGMPLSVAKAGQSILVRTSLKNTIQASLDYVYIIQVKDDGQTVFLALKNGNIGPLGLSTPAVSWMPEVEGTYTVEVFVWSDIDRPEPLSHVERATITVRE
jgi:plastocyanin